MRPAIENGSARGRPRSPFIELRSLPRFAAQPVKFAQEIAVIQTEASGLNDGGNGRQGTAWQAAGEQKSGNPSRLI